jgi:hypothetical protein
MHISSILQHSVVKSARSMNRWELTDHIDRNASAIVKEGKVNQLFAHSFNLRLSG